MKRLSLKEITKVLGIDFTGPDVIIRKVHNDIDKISDYSLTFHLNKNKPINRKLFNGLRHAYLVTDQPPLREENIPRERALLVANVGNAYREFLGYYRRLFDFPVVAVTGTCGKTSTKEMITQVLRKKSRVVATFQSKNNLRHYHRYLMRFDDSCDFGVFETALTHPGHVIAGCEIVKPQIGIITKIGVDHLNHCKSMDLYIKAKAEMLTALGSNGTLIINGDCENIKKIDFSYFKGKIITFGIDNRADFRGTNLKYLPRGMRFTLSRKGREYRAHLPAYGKHNVYNALAALAALDALGAPLTEAIQSLRDYKPIRSHTEVFYAPGGSLMIDDTWSANPTSLEAALEVLTHLGKEKKKIVVIGRISYLGTHTDLYYQKAAEAIAQAGVDCLITKGSSAVRIAQYAAQAGMRNENIAACANNHEVKENLLRRIDAQTAVLFKVSMLDKSFRSLIEEFKK
jgi:UDP-N-acetylmuramoyl-tripeptide--D-alanyl-D-alanine ligase